jgi:hypothetical protein
MLSRTIRIQAVILILLTGAAPASAEMIYDNSTTSLGSLTFTALQVGNEVQAAGTARQVIELDIGVNQQGTAGTADLQAFLYANDGAGGQPGTQLWASPLESNVALTGGNDLIAFSVPDVTVPDTFTWAIQISNPSPIAAGVPAFDPPAVGSVVRGWAGGPGSWSNLDSLGDDAHFEARISAVSAVTVPEPASVILLCAGVAGLLASARHRNDSE